MKQKLRQKLYTLLTILCLAATSVVTVATSKKSNSPAESGNSVQTYLVASNCPNAIYQERVVVDGLRTIAEPRNRLFMDFGLPMEYLDFQTNTTISGYIQGQLRSCHLSINYSGNRPLNVYTCMEGSYQVCQVSFESESTF